MHKTQKIVIFSSVEDFSLIIKHKNLFKYEIIGLVTPNESINICYDKFLIENEHLKNIEVKTELSFFFDKCDSVLFLDSSNSINLKATLLPKMIECAINKKNILNTIEIDIESEEYIHNVCKENEVDFTNFNDNVKYDLKHISKHPLISINTPILFVLGVSKNVNKFEIQLELREKFLREGYRVSQIGSRRYCEVMGFHSFPKFMYDEGFTEVEKINSFNHFVAKIEKDENPDLVIIGIPGGISKINELITNEYGIFAYEVAQAITPDVVVFSTFYEDVTNEYYHRLNNLAKYKLGFELDYFNLANIKFDWAVSHQIKEEAFLTLSSQFIDNKISNANLKDVLLFNILNKEDAEKMFVCIKNKFEEYSEIEII